MMFSNLRREGRDWIVDGVDGGPWKIAKVSGTNACGMYRLGNGPYAQLYIYDGELNHNRMVRELKERNMWIDVPRKDEE